MDENLLKKKKMFIISIIVFVICLAITVFLFIKVNMTEISDYKKVNCVVTKVDSYFVKKQIRYKVYATYEEKEYEICNIKNDSYKYSKGSKVEVYLYQENLYANYDGIKTSTPVAKIYFVFLFLTFGCLILPITFGIIYNKEKKKIKY